MCTFGMVEFNHGVSVDVQKIGGIHNRVADVFQSPQSRFVRI